jgi:Fe-S cluster assembly iron-binding protein IscA
MIELTDSAKEVLDQHFEGKEKEPIRIFVTSGCGGARLAMGLDTAKEEDEKFDVNGYEFVVDKELYEQAKPLKVDLTPIGIDISSSLVFEQTEGSCGSCCGGCGE